jgi:hypothetical protein
MASGGFLRVSLIALLIAAQSTALAFAAAAPALAAECPAHAAKPAPRHDRPDHSGHAAAMSHADHEAEPAVDAAGDSGAQHPTAFAFACCMGHIVGVVELAQSTVKFRRFGFATGPDPSFVQPDIASADPPPRPAL